MSSRQTIAVFPPPENPPVRRLLRCLAAAFPVDFVAIGSLDLLDHDAVLLLADDDASQLKALSSSCPAVFSAPAGTGPSQPLAGEIRFSRDAMLDAPLRGQAIACKLETRVCVAELSGFVPLATAGDAAIWTSSNARLHHRSNISLGGLAENEDIIDALLEYAFISVLPLVDFIRRLNAHNAWDRPDLRALLIIDDPNLHSGRYGCIDYAAFAVRARQTGFHASMATIPLDGWFVSSRAKELFRNYADVLSLSVHGNDHDHKELAQSVSTAEAAAIIAQAVSRIAVLEKRSGLAIAKVMIPPHGVCSQTFLDAMAGAGFHGATTTRTAIWENISRAQRVPGSGMGPAELVGGFPVIHRFRFNSERWRHRIAISAYLRHPLVAHGHQEDFAQGLDAFDAVATHINQLGARWVNPAEMFASNFESRREGKTLWIRPFSLHCVVPTGGDCSEIRLDLEGVAGGPGGIVKFSPDNSGEIRRIPASEPIPVGGLGTVAISMASSSNVATTSVPGRRTRLTSILRRVMTEGRDRWGRLRPKTQQ